MRSKKELDDWLQEQWAQRSGTLADHQRVGLSVTEIVAYAEKRNSARESNLVELWVAILDELISWQSSLCTVLFHAKPFTNWYRSLLILLMKIISDAMAIRQLIIAGLNASALTLLRSTGEYIEVFVAILDEPTLADEFVKTDTLEEANRFWWSHVAKGK